MADIRSRALESLDGDSSTDFERRYANAILDLVRSELSTELLANEMLNLDALFFNPLRQRYNGPVDEIEHFYPGYSLTVVMWSLPDGTVKPSYPINNIYDCTYSADLPSLRATRDGAEAY